MNPLNLIDFYKADHRNQYPDGTGLVFSNFTPRKSRIPGVDRVIFFGLQYYIQQYLVKLWNEEFFQKPKAEVVERYRNRIAGAGITITYEHIEALHDHGKLPITIWALPEGSAVPVGVPTLVMWNTLPEFFWLTNYLETSLSNTLWGPCTAATIANEYYKILERAAVVSGGDLGFVPWQGHDFSARGMYGPEAAAMSGAGHLTSFLGTDTVSAIDFLEDYYQATGLIGGSVPATEHSVMCMGGDQDELATYHRLLTDVYPSGIVAIVSDTWDFWQVVTKHLPALKDVILARDGKLVIRPDSGDPVDILCGHTVYTDKFPQGSPQSKGLIECLWDTFGGTVTAEGYKQLDPHIGAIYGDSITLDRAEQITRRLLAKKFVPNMVLGIGSFTYQHVTRDTFGFAMKATYGEIRSRPREIFKDPKTDDGEKKSAKGLLAVFRRIPGGEYFLKQQASWHDVEMCEFQCRFENGQIHNAPTLASIRQRISAER